MLKSYAARKTYMKVEIGNIYSERSSYRLALGHIIPEVQGILHEPLAEAYQELMFEQ